MMPPSKKLPLRHKIGATVTPGDRLGLITSSTSRKGPTLVAGRGTYSRQGHLYASVVGTLCAAPIDNNSHEEEGENSEKWLISIRQPGKEEKTEKPICPQVGMLVLGRISKVIRPTHATVDIVAIVPEEDKNDSSSSSKPPVIIPLHEPFSGTLRQNEIRPNSSLEIQIHECIRPTDLILARIHANGERDFVLTTAEAELGVIQARCESSGEVMRAVSWKEMQCVKTGVKEGRKVAKPRQQIR